MEEQTGTVSTNSPLMPGIQTRADVETSALDVGDEHILKVRKPYIITKQRERWAEEEHKKFLEALQLYGRAWRRIEEHIGTKTAVQIRSHAQKFFSKVVRESTTDGTGDVKPIEIPPPRPKRKPSHPYPRKLGNASSNGVQSLGKCGRSLSPVEPAYEQASGSPTSVLSEIGSDTLGSLPSNPQNRCASPVNSAAGSNEQEAHDQSVKDVPSKEEEKHVPCLKLFGKTVMVTGSHKPSSPVSETVTQIPNSLPTLGSQDRSAHIDFGTQTQNFLQGAVHMYPMFFSLPSAAFGDMTNPAEARMIYLPWRGVCGNLRQLPSSKTFSEEYSGTGCNTASVSEGANAGSLRNGDRSDGPAVGSKRASSGAALKGFVPYKRCVIHQEVQQQQQQQHTMADDGESRSIGLCL